MILIFQLVLNGFKALHLWDYSATQQLIATQPVNKLFLRENLSCQLLVSIYRRPYGILGSLQVSPPEGTFTVCY